MPEPDTNQDSLFPIGPAFGPAFLERLAGKHLLHDPLVAATELIANAWDAGATRVDISWPSEVDPYFAVLDNGSGMSATELAARWYTLAYDRRASQGSEILVKGLSRKVYGKNGVGRLAAFCFGDQYKISTTKLNSQTTLVVKRTESADRPFDLKDVQVQGNTQPNGTRISVDHAWPCSRSAADLVEYLSLRFLTDETFQIFVNQAEVSLASIPEHLKSDEVLILPHSREEIPLVVVTIEESDRTTRFHGFAFRIGSRFVGEPSWELPGIENQIDGRRALAKRLLIIADIANFEGYVSSDWTSLDGQCEQVQELSEALSAFARTKIETRSEDEVQDAVESIRAANSEALEDAPKVVRHRWNVFVDAVVRDCPSLTSSEISKVSRILVNLEKSQSKFGLLTLLSEAAPDDLDSLHKILSEWSIHDARTVLDELQTRLTLLENLKRRTPDIGVDEVRELQPLFHSCLWIFGPEYESIEFTSNRSMNSVMRSLLGAPETSGSRNRPDFVILPDGSAGCYSLPSFGDLDEDAGEMGIDRMVIVELKRAGVPLDEKEKSQPWRYTKEFLNKGLITRHTKVRCFVLGSEIAPGEEGTKTDGEGFCKIYPMTYANVIERAESRLFYLSERLKNSPFMQSVAPSVFPEMLRDAAGPRPNPLRAI